MSKMLTERFERLNALVQVNGASKYLEIGVDSGRTFTKVEAPYKVGVDPNFKFDTSRYADSNTRFHDVTSDDFFAKHASMHGAFDLIYLDGLHTFEQTFRDFCASLTFAHSRTIWLIDDTNPTGILAMNPDYRLAYRLRRLLRIKDRRWMGDIFKVVFAIRDFFPQFSYATFPEHGQTVVWYGTRENFEPKWNSLKKISNLGYRDFLVSKDELVIMPPAELVARLNSRFERN